MGSAEESHHGKKGDNVTWGGNVLSSTAEHGEGSGAVGSVSGPVGKSGAFS